MRSFGPDWSWWQGSCALALAAAGAMLAACASSDSGESAHASVGSGSWTSRLTSFFSSSGQTPQRVATDDPNEAEIDCPTVDIRPGASRLAIEANGKEANAKNLRYQLSFNQTARECRVAGGVVTMKVGVQGRVILGPAGGPGQVDVPLRYAVVQEGPEPKTIVTKFHRFPVTLAPGDSNVPFVHIEEELSFPRPPPRELDAYVVYIGFDQIGDKDQKSKKPPAKSKKALPRPK